MDDSAVADLFVAEMRPLVAALRGQSRHVEQLAGDRFAAWSDEFKRQATALFDLSATFDIEDCALVCRSLAAFQDKSSVEQVERAHASVEEALTYVERRLEAMAAARVLLPATFEDLAGARKIAVALQQGSRAEAALVSGLAPLRDLEQDGRAWSTPSSDATSRDADETERDTVEEPLTDEELALVARFQASTLRAGAESDTRGHVIAQPESIAGPAAVTPSPNASFAPAGAQPPVAVSPLRDTTAGSVYQTGHDTPSAEELDVIPPALRRLFLVETAEDLQDLRVALLKLGESADELSALHAMRRIAHKIRGSAGTLQFPHYEKIALVYEELLKTVQQSELRTSPLAHSVLLHGLVILQTALAGAETAGDADIGLLRQAEALVRELRVTLEERPSAPTADTRPAASSSSLGMTAADAATRLSGGFENESSLRVDVRRLDTLIGHATELTINRAGISHHIEDVGRLQAEIEQSVERLHHLSAQLTDTPPSLPNTGPSTHQVGHRQARQLPGFGLLRRGAVTQSGQAHPRQDERIRWDELELDKFTETDDALRALAEAISDLSANTSMLKLALTQLSRLSISQAELATEIQRDVMHVRLVPLSELAPRLHLEVKGVAPLVHKEVAFHVRGEMTHIDRNISDALAEPLIQLVRNAVTHGIEPAEERIDHGKAAAGEVWMNAYYVGSEVVIEIGDDGGGVNPNQLAYRAVMANFIDESAVHDMTPQEKLDLMFVPGLTRFDAAQAIGGQGIGLDGVKAAIQQLKGSIQVRSEPGSGTVFRVRVPISLSIVRALHVQAAEETFAVPVSSVQRMVTLSPIDILTTTEANTDVTRPGSARTNRHIRVDVSGDAPNGEQRYEDIPLVALADLLNLASEQQREQQMALIIEVGRRRVGVLVDDVAGDSEVVVQALPPHLRRHAVRGATVTPDGQVRLLVDLPELIADLRADGRSTGAPRLRPAPRLTRALAPRVLVVDDSVSIRRTLELTLTRAHFEVQLARDGVEALEMMLVTPPRVVILDIEMPRLDGFELLTMMRESPQFERARVVMLTSRASEKHRLHAQALGASAYLVKPCPQEILIDTVRGLLEEQPAP